mgnify:CR=1 FL=1
MSKVVTVKQALALKYLGFNEPCIGYHLPTVDEAIDWLRRKFHVIVYDATEPFVDPIKKHILYAYRVKYCNVRWGWNQREQIGCSKRSKDSYAAKRTAIWIAIRYIIKTKKNAERRRNNKTWRKGIQSSCSKTRRATVLKLRN